jgi:hypothetical protein
MAAQLVASRVLLGCTELVRKIIIFCPENYTKYIHVIDGIKSKVLKQEAYLYITQPELQIFSTCHVVIKNKI